MMPRCGYTLCGKGCFANVATWGTLGMSHCLDFGCISSYLLSSFVFACWD